MQNHRNLAVWQKAHALAVAVNDLVRPIERRDRSGFSSQARRAALSIPSNIAEGCGRQSNRDLAKFLQIAIASATELEYQLEFAAATKLVAESTTDPLRTQTIEVRRMLFGLLKRVKERREKV